MKSEAELDAILVELEEREPFRGAFLELLSMIAPEALAASKLASRLRTFELCRRDVYEALNIPQGTFGAERARRNTKAGLVKAMRKVDEELDKQWASANDDARAHVLARAEELAVPEAQR